MTILNPIVSVVLYSIIEFCGLLFILATMLSISKAKTFLTCKKCGKLNKILYKKCSYCDSKMKQWIGEYITFFRVRVSCKNKEGYPDYKKTILIMLSDLSLIILIMGWGVYGLVNNIMKIIN